MLSRSLDRFDLDLLVLPDTNLLLFAAVVEPLRGANRISGSELYRWRVLTLDGMPVQTTSGLPIPANGSFGQEPDERPLFVLASYNWRAAASRDLRMRLSRAARYRSLIAGVESGTWLLADASLLNGVRATVHWEDHEEFGTAYPQVALSKDRFVVDGKRITSAGPLPTVDLMLEIIRKRQGETLAFEVGRLFSYERATSLREALPASPAARKIGDSRVARALEIMEGHIEQPIPLSRIARRLGMTSRHLQSLFKRSLGSAPQAHYLALRLNAARRRVIETQTPLVEIAAETGFNSASAFARSYRTRFAESPSETRRRRLDSDHASAKPPGIPAEGVDGPVLSARRPLR